MGSRASYVIVENGEATAYYAQWGGEGIEATLLDGPDAALAEVRNRERRDAILNNVWAEGGIAFDVDRRQVRFFSWSMSESRFRRALLPALRALWAGWDIAWAEQGIVDVAACYGWVPDRVLDLSDDNLELLEGTAASAPDEAILSAPESPWNGSILTVRWSEAGVEDHLLGVLAADALSCGPRLLDLVRGRKSIPLPREDDQKFPSTGVYVDVGARVLWIDEHGTIDPRIAPAIARRWPGWEVHAHIGGLVRQVELSGRRPTRVRVSDEEAVDGLLERLTSGLPTKLAVRFLLSIVQTFAAHGLLASTNIGGKSLATLPDTDINLIPSLRAALRETFLRLLRADASPKTPSSP